MSKPLTNIAASVGQRLRNLARDRNEDFALVLTKFALERVLFRLSQSKHSNVFTLKGALLFEVWTQQRYRPTRDADFLARGESTPERFIAIFKTICKMTVIDDGLRFDAESVTSERIAEDATYEGVRVNFRGYLENARIPIQIDIGFGDVITPPAAEAEFPTLLDFPAPKLLIYTKESVVAEKFEAMVNLGITNSRMKDFYDVWSLCREFAFDGYLLSGAILNTFTRRQTKFPDKHPLVFTSEFYEDESKKKQWSGFCNKNKRYIAQISLEHVCLAIGEFLRPIVEALKENEQLKQKWRAGGPWTRKTSE